MYKGHSDWSHIARVKNNPRITMPIFEWRHRLARKSVTIKMNGIDGIMIGRAPLVILGFLTKSHFFLKQNI
jgi:hypothetical protein